MLSACYERFEQWCVVTPRHVTPRRNTQKSLYSRTTTMLNHWIFLAHCNYRMTKIWRCLNNFYLYGWFLCMALFSCHSETSRSDKKYKFTIQVKSQFGFSLTVTYYDLSYLLQVLLCIHQIAWYWKFKTDFK